MSSRPVQISLDQQLLQRIDKDPQTKREGRSAFIRDAIQLYLSLKQRRAVDAQIVRAFKGQADELLDDATGMMGSQAWPDE